MTDQRPVDLHVHSNQSDGTCTPTELVELALQKGLAAFALTDHDCVDGIAEAMEAARGKDVEVIPGIEFSTEYVYEHKEEGSEDAQTISRDVHIVGLGFDWKDHEFQEQIREFVDARDLRNRRMCEKMATDGMPISYEALMEESGDAVVTRAHFASFLLNHGIVQSREEAFNDLIGDDCPYFISREKISPEKAVAFTKKFNGIAVLAHPFQYKLSDSELEELIVRLKKAGLDAIEAYYCKHTPEMTQKIIELADKYDLLLSGGSDFHGANKPGLEMGNGYGHLHVPGELLIRMKHRLHGINDKTKIFFCDFDGTLGNNEKIITPRTRKALDDFVARGNIFALSTGRAMGDIKDIVDRLELHYPNMYLCSYNGAEIYDCDKGETFYRETLPRDTVKRVFELAEAFDLHCQTYEGKDIVCKHETKETKYYTQFNTLRLRFDEAPWDAISEDPCKCLIIELEKPEEKIPPFVKAAEEELGDVLHCIMSNSYYLEVDPVRATKGKALEWLCRHLGIDIANSYAAGDAPNDVSMVEIAGCGIAMSNGLIRTSEMQPAAEGLGEAADIITETDNNHDGLAPIIEKM